MKQQPLRKIHVKSLFGEHKVTDKEEIKVYIHENFEIYYGISGGCKFYIDNKIYDISPRDLFIIPPECVRLCLTNRDEKHERYVVYAHPKFLRPMTEVGIDIVSIFEETYKNKTHKMHLNENQHNRLMVLLDKFLTCSGYGKDMVQYAVAIEIMVFVCSLLVNIKDSQHIEQIEESKIDTIMKFIEKNLASDLSLATIAKSLGLKERSLSTIFKKETNTTVCNYIIKCRISEAKKLLAENVPVTQVSEMVGYKTYTHFGRSFHSFVGQSPKKYQLLLQKQYCNNDKNIMK